MALHLHRYGGSDLSRQRFRQIRSQAAGSGGRATGAADFPLFLVLNDSLNLKYPLVNIE
jgi:hypothetical protein